ncbi:putative LPS assembly protein LptD [Blattabacterium cuenoti]|uniref:putative LPS assembly protein LptD n=1 Tax=Blattabacterium cuenoti TaxID=1653831 RepID=UPI001EEA88A3|nr:putative LPS assembly protein LptD [Blattabacterium cuenoti]
MNFLISINIRMIFFIFLFVFYVYANDNKKNENIIFPNLENKLYKDIIKYDSNIQEHNIEKGISYLKGKANIEYNDTKIKADYIEFNWKSGDIHAIQKENPIVVEQGNHKYISNNIYANLKSKKIEIKNFYVQEKDYIIIANNIIKKDNNISLLKKVTYISDPFFIKKKDNHPDFYLQTDYIKYFNNNTRKYILSGPIFFYWYQVPMPIFFPFLFIPFKKQHNEVSYGIMYPKFGIQNNKIYIENIGFFFPIYDFINFKIFGSIHHTNKWNLKTKIEYKLKSSYHGYFNYQYTVENKSNYQFQWKHIQDFKSGSKINFNANINYNKNILFTNHENEDFSYIHIRKKFSNYLLFMDAYMIQENDNHKVKTRFIIPEFIFHIKDSTFGENYFLRHIKTDSKVSIHNLMDYYYQKISFQTILNHQMNMSIYFPFFYPYVKIVPKLFLEEFYTWKYLDFYPSFSSFHQIDFSTDIIIIPFYGTLKLKKNSIFLEHKIDPMLSFHIRYFPNVFHNVKSHLEKTINLILNNNLDIQFNKYKTIRIIKNLKTSFIINPSFIKWNNLLLNGKIELYNDLEVRYQGEINFEKEKKMHLSFYCNYNYDTNFFHGKNKYNKKGENRYDYFFFDRKNYAKYPIPFNLKIDFQSNYIYINKKKSFDTFLCINGSMKITKYWKIDINVKYDLYNKKIIFSNITCYRDLRSFKMSFNWIPMNKWSFFIGIKDKNLSDYIQYNEKKLDDR